MLPSVVHSTAFLVLLQVSLGTSETGTRLPNGRNISKLETETPPLPYNTNNKVISEVCSRQGARIIGGAAARQGDFPYQVSIRRSGWSPGHVCGGSIIDDQHILTAAHCVYGKGPGDFSIVAGDVMLDRSSCTSVRRSVSAIFMHKEYNTNTFENDIALIRISKPFPTDNKNIMAINLRNMTLNEGTACNVTGWGKTSTSNPALPNNLQYVEVPIIPADKCSDSNDYNIGDGMVCAGCSEGGRDACQGDSGGPLQCEGYLVGIVSWGRGCALAGYPGVYTNVGFYEEWISETKSG